MIIVSLSNLEMNSEINKPLIIIGGNGHGSVIAACVNDNRRRFSDYEWDVKGYCNDYDNAVDGYPVLGKISDIPLLLEQGYYFAWGIHLIGRNIKTAKLFNSIKIPDNRWATIIHKTAFISDSVILDPGVFIMANAYIAPRTKIGKCTMIKANTNIGHDVIVGALSHIAMGAIVVSCVELGFCSNIAIGASILANCKIGDYAMLGASSLATRDIPSKEIHVGSPASFLKYIKED